MVARIGHYIGNKLVAGTSGRAGDVTNPATGDVTAMVAFASAAEIDDAVQLAKKAQIAWAATPPLRRQRVMFNLKGLVEKRLDDLARLMSLEHGKTFDDAKGEVGRGLEVIEFSCGIAHHMKGDFTEQVASDMDSWSIRQPLGVVAGITPFNFPIMIPCWMGAMAVACGNAFILKPSEKDPSAPMLLAELFAEAGAPSGIFQVLNGDKVAVDALLHHPDVPAISFVGSTAIGQYVYHTGTQQNKRVQALCGAKNHMVIMPDADLDQATDALIGAGYGAAGERCMAISVAVAVGDVGDRLMAKLAPRVAALTFGCGSASASDSRGTTTGSAAASCLGAQCAIAPRAEIAPACVRQARPGAAASSSDGRHILTPCEVSPAVTHRAAASAASRAGAAVSARRSRRAGRRETT